MIKINWSDYQKKIFFNASKETGHSIILAFAGSGKTRTLIESIKYIPKGKKILALSFNKSIQKQLKQQVPIYVQAQTFHSFGYQAIKNRFGNVEIDEYKTFNIVKDLIGNDQPDLLENIVKTVEQCKNTLKDSPKDIEDLIFKFGIDTCETDLTTFVRYVVQTLGKSKSITKTIDFSDMCWFYFVYNLSLPQYDYVIIDEFQDMSKNQLVMAQRACNPKDGRLMFYGDIFQELYAWRSSDTASVKKMINNNEAKVLSLPISYRCPKKVIELCQKWVPGIQAAPQAIEGEINEIFLDKMFELIKPGAFILSRTNAPLIKICLTLIRNKIKASIRGRDIGSNLNYLIKKSKKKTIPAFLTWLEKWEKEELEKLKAKNINPTNHLDKCLCLKELCEENKTLHQVSETIKKLFNDKDEDNKVCLSTVHKAKGDERNVVFILQWTFWQWFRDDFTSNDGESEEMNIAYVACSRTKDKLYLVNK